MKLKPLLLLTALSFSLPAMAENAVTPQVSQGKQEVTFSTEVEKYVERDELQVTLFYQSEGTDLNALNKALTERMNKAVGIAKAQSAVEIKGNSRNTHVRYNEKGKQSGWIARAELTLESKDFQALSKVINELESLLTIDNVQASVSSEKLMSLENELTQAALAKFQAKATLIQQSLQKKGYDIVDLDVSSVNEPDRGYANYGVALKAAAMSMDSMNAPDIYQQNGKEKIKVRVNARIALLKE